jgi:hypothetical protein
MVLAPRVTLLEAATHVSSGREQSGRDSERARARE